MAAALAAAAEEAAEEAGGSISNSYCSYATYAKIWL